MNAERLHAIAIALKKDLTSSGILSHLQNLTNSLTNLVSQPGHPDYQRSVSANLEALESALSLAEVNEFSPTWRQVLEETGIDHLLGHNLIARIKLEIANNQLTPTVAVQEIQKILAGVQNLITHVDQLLAAFDFLEVGKEDLDAGECEIGVLVPRTFVDNRLDKFSDELEELDHILGTFSELATGSRPSFEIRTISSSDLSIYLDAAPAVGACLAVAIERIVGLYKQLLEIRKLQGELKKQGLEQKNLEGIEQHANGVMDHGIDALVKDLFKEFHANADAGRSNELKIELKYSLKKIANRIDRGFNIEVRMEEPEAADDAEGEPSSEAEAQQYHERIKSAANGMQFLKLDGDPILRLQEEPRSRRKPGAPEAAAAPAPTPDSRAP